MKARINPFQELYVGDSIDPDKYVSLFSDVIVENALALFQPGHVILKGLPGSGKSMLLNLLKPSVRIAYATSNAKFPVPKELMKFIGAGINLKRSGVSDFGQRPIIEEIDSDTTPLYFGDFLNYWLVSDILLSIQKYVEEDSTEQIIKDLKILFSKEKLDLFALDISRNDCWSGYLDNIQCYDDLIKKLNGRITTYRAYLNYNIREMPKDISSTKTLIGVPISKTVDTLRKFGIIGKEVEVYIRIDQFEDLAWLGENKLTSGTLYQEMIHKLLGMRDANVSYRIGTRHFAWNRSSKKMYGSNGRLEKNRNYTEIDIDSLLRRGENSRTWVFPKFAEDIFNRRIKQSPYTHNFIKEPLLNYVFGGNGSPAEIAKMYFTKGKEKAIRIEESWPKEWVAFLMDLVNKDPLSARLAEAWCRQKGKEKIMDQKLIVPYPWEKTEKKWWKKERIEQALMQIASRNQQQLIYFGKDDVLNLSGSNILIFLSICQHVWDVYIRDNRNERIDSELNLPTLDKVIQSIGIREASSTWFESLTDERGGNDRKMFIAFLGKEFHKKLVEDKAMSYPGNNGFSLTIEDWEKDQKVNKFLNEATDYGDLYFYTHTSKLKNKLPRYKWYLNPILSPYFKIPYVHTKEPIYIDLNTIISWLLDSKVFNESDFESFKKSNKSKPNKNQTTGQRDLFE